jgi:septum formation protein
MNTAGPGNPDFIYLASASPRRSELLTQLGLTFDVVPADIDESVRPGEEGAEYVQRLASNKSRVALSALARGGPAVLAADTAVVVDQEILGKPVDEADAVRMLTLLSGRTHLVLTAVSVRNDSRDIVELCRSTVRFRAISASQISDYWQTGEPRGKAGAYAIQGLGALFIEEIRGSYSGVMGLPLYETARILDYFGYRFF